MVRIRSATAVAVLFALSGCNSGKGAPVPATSSESKGQVGQYYYVNLFQPPVGGVIASSEAPAPRIKCGASSLGTPTADGNGVLQYAPVYYDGANACGTKGQTRYGWGEQVVLTATPAEGYAFYSWAGDCAGTGPCTLTAGADKTVVAVFTRGQFFSITVAKVGGGSGTITADVPGRPPVVCGTATSTCQFAVPATTPPTLAVLTVQPGATSHFVAWSGACSGPGACTVTADAAKQADARIEPNVVGGTVVGTGGAVVQSPTGVTVSVPPAAIDTPAAFSVTVAVNPPAPPPGVQPITPIYQFEPAGQVFAAPVTVRLPVPAGTTSACIWWQEQNAAAYECIGGTLTGDGFIETQVSHFSDAFVGPAAAVHTVQGARINTHVTSGGKFTTSPDAMELDTIAVWLRDANGGFTRLPGTGLANGTFSVQGVPDASSPILQFGPGSTTVTRFVDTRETNLDLGQIINGRVGLTPIAATDHMPIDLHVDGLLPYQIADQIDVFSVDADTWLFWAQATPPVMLGNTSLVVTDLRRTGNLSPMFAIDGMRDEIMVTQLSQAVTGAGTGYRQLRRSGRVTGVTVTPTTPAQFASVTLEDLLPWNAVSLDWDVPRFRASLPQGAPGGCQAPYTSFQVLGQPGTSQVGMTTREEKRYYLSATLNGGALDPVSTGDMTFGTPEDLTYAETYGLHWYAYMACSTPVPGPAGGTLSLATFFMQFGAYAPPRTLVSLGAPVLSPPRNLTIDGLPLSAPQPDLMDGPVIAWEAPDIGTPGLYTVVIQKMSGGTPSYTFQTVAVFYTDGTSVRLPPGLIEKGVAHSVLVTASTGAQVTRPSRFLLPAARARQGGAWFTISPSFQRVGGRITGLVGDGLVLSAAGQPGLEVPSRADGFMLANPLPVGSSYEVTISSQPSNPPQICAISNGVGTVGNGATPVVTCEAVTSIREEAARAACLATPTAGGSPPRR